MGASDPPDFFLCLLAISGRFASIFFRSTPVSDSITSGICEITLATSRVILEAPELSPSPRAGHAFLYLPKSRKLALVGGYGFNSHVGYQGPMYKQPPVQAWTYDVTGNTWRFVKQWPLAAAWNERKEIPGAAP